MVPPRPRSGLNRPAGSGVVPGGWGTGLHAQDISGEQPTDNDLAGDYDRDEGPEHQVRAAEVPVGALGLDRPAGRSRWGW